MVKNPYKVLGVSNNTSIQDCRKAYRKLCAKYHPDNPTGDREKFDEIQKAFSMIEKGYVSLNLPRSRSLSHQGLFKFKVILG